MAGLLARIGFMKGFSGEALPEKPAHVAAVLVDMESLHKLTASIEGHTLSVTKAYLHLEKIAEHDGEIAISIAKLCTIFDDKHREEVEDRLAEIDAKLEEISRPTAVKRRTRNPLLRLKRSLNLHASQRDQLILTA